MARVLPSSARSWAASRSMRNFRETPVPLARDYCDSPRSWRRARIMAPTAAGASMLVADVVSVRVGGVTGWPRRLSDFGADGGATVR